MANKFDRFGLKGGVCLLLGTLMLSGGLHYSKNFRQKPQIVRVGQIEHSQKDLVTYDLATCSAVVFDYKDSAIMVHALPVLDNGLEFKLGDRKLISVWEAVDYLIKESEKHGLNTKEARVYVSAGDEKSLDIITNDLNARGINVIQGNIRPEKKEILKFSKDNITLFKRGEFHDYRDPRDVYR
jgi:hypothetical protein